MLTTEQLRARAESLRLGFFIERRAGVWVKEWLNNGCTSATAEEVMMWSMLADREAQPVAWRHDNGPFAGMAITRAKSVADSWIAKGWTVTPLYTAQPAPAVPEEIPEVDRGEGGSDIDYMQPQEIYDMGKTDGWNACRAAMLNHVGDANEKAAEKCECSSIDYCENCLRAMLAQPVSQRYTFNSPEIPDGWKLVPLAPTNKMILAAMGVDGCSSSELKGAYQAMLAAAPEGGNG
ncbi:TPA: hypothetical protein ACXI1U_002014 [Serratia marcescens]